MLYLRVTGPKAGACLDALSPRTVTDLPVDRARFVLFTTPAGTVDEEAVVVRTAPEEFQLSCGGGKPPGWLADTARHLGGVTVEESDTFSFNIKGPHRLAAVQSLVHPDDAQAVAMLKNFHSSVVRAAAGGWCRVLKTLIGYDVWARPDILHETWKLLLTARPHIVPCAWDALTTYRMECTSMVFGLYPMDWHSGTHLRDIGFTWMCDQTPAHQYIGAEALRNPAHRPRLWLAGLRTTGEAPLPPVGREIVSRSGTFAGHLTSVATSPDQRLALGFGHLTPDCPPAVPSSSTEPGGPCAHSRTGPPPGWTAPRFCLFGQKPCHNYRECRRLEGYSASVVDGSGTGSTRRIVKIVSRRVGLGSSPSPEVLEPFSFPVQTNAVSPLPPAAATGDQAREEPARASQGDVEAPTR